MTDAPSWLSLVLPMALQLSSGNIQIQFEVQFEVAQNVAMAMLREGFNSKFKI